MSDVIMKEAAKDYWTEVLLSNDKMFFEHQVSKKGRNKYLINSNIVTKHVYMCVTCDVYSNCKLEPDPKKRTKWKKESVRDWSGLKWKGHEEVWVKVG